MQDLNGLTPERLDAVEDPLAGAEQDRRDVQRELVDDPGNEGLAHSRGAARDVYAALPGRLARTHLKATPEARALLERAVDRLGLSARGYQRVLRVARTAADLEAATVIGSAHVSEALRFRPQPTDRPA